MAARVGFEPTEVALGRFQGGCTRPLCDLANRARPGGHILAMILDHDSTALFTVSARGGM